jgi:hypothetical protein
VGQFPVKGVYGFGAFYGGNEGLFELFGIEIIFSNIIGGSGFCAIEAFGVGGCFGIYYKGGSATGLFHAFKKILPGFFLICEGKHENVIFPGIGFIQGKIVIVGPIDMETGIF